MKALEILKHFKGMELTYEDTLFSIKYYDEAIKELEQLRNRSCDSCKHIRITQFRDYEKATCTNENCNEMFDCDVGSDFCCNKWENKQ